MRKLTLTILALITIFVLAACGNSGNNAEETNDGDGGKLAELQDKGVIQVGFANEKPYGYENDKGEITGASVDRKSTRLNSSHVAISYAVFCLKKKKK